jgi:hypothetical protein
MSYDPISVDEAPRYDLEPRVTVAAYSTPWEAQLVRARLEAAGIEASLADEHTIRLAWMFSYAMGGVKLQVRPEDLAAAEEALARAEPLPEIYLVEEGERIAVHRCPACRSPELVYRRWSLGAFVGSWLLLGFPLPVLRRRWSCRACGTAWKEDELAD